MIMTIFEGSITDELRWFQIRNQWHCILRELYPNLKKNKSTLGVEVTRSLDYLVVQEKLERKGDRPKNYRFHLTEIGKKYLEDRRHDTYLIEKSIIGTYEPDDSYPQFQRKLRKRIMELNEERFKQAYKDWCEITNSPEKYVEVKVSRHRKNLKTSNIPLTKNES